MLPTTYSDLFHPYGPIKSLNLIVLVSEAPSLWPALLPGSRSADALAALAPFRLGLIFLSLSASFASFVLPFGLVPAS